MECLSWDALVVVTRLVTSDIGVIPRVCKEISAQLFEATAKCKAGQGTINCTAREAAGERELSESTQKKLELEDSHATSVHGFVHATLLAFIHA
jgi:hypothetical protein